MECSLLAFLLVLLLAFANGTKDVSKAIATLVGSGVTAYSSAVWWGAVWTVFGAAISATLATAMVKTFSSGFIRPGVVIAPALTLAVLSGAIVWVLFASRTGLPVSTTDALTGSLVGVGLMAFGTQGLVWSTVAHKIVLPLLLSPVLSLAVSFLFHPLIRLVANRWEGFCVCIMPSHRALVTVDTHGGTHTLFQATGFGTPIAAVPAQCDRAGLAGFTLGVDSIHWLSSGLTALARGTNDAPKIAAILVLGSAVASWPSPTFQFAAFAGVAIAMGVGSYWGGRCVTEMLAEKVTRMDHVEGLSANLTTSSLVMISATLGLPVSTTHVRSSAIIGIGLLRGLTAVCWTTVRDMVLAWIITIPASALLAGVAYLLLTRLL
jgi:PiT family inorganic phosphate transporter